MGQKDSVLKYIHLMAQRAGVSVLNNQTLQQRVTDKSMIVSQNKFDEILKKLGKNYHYK